MIPKSIKDKTLDKAVSRCYTEEDFINSMSVMSLCLSEFMRRNFVDVLIRKEPNLKTTSKLSKKSRLYIRDVYVGRRAYIVMISKSNKITGIYKKLIKYRWTDIRDKHRDDMAYIFIMKYHPKTFQEYEQWAFPDDPKLSEEEYCLYQGVDKEKMDRIPQG